jgi:hypothetical protein
MFPVKFGVIQRILTLVGVISSLVGLAIRFTLATRLSRLIGGVANDAIAHIRHRKHVLTDLGIAPVATHSMLLEKSAIIAGIVPIVKKVTSFIQ